MARGISNEVAGRKWMPDDKRGLCQIKVDVVNFPIFLDLMYRIWRNPDSRFKVEQDKDQMTIGIQETISRSQTNLILTKVTSTFNFHSSHWHNSMQIALAILALLQW